MQIGANLMMRRVIQIGFALFLVFMGWQFINFVLYLETGGMEGSPYRPAGVEGFLPVAALVGFRYWIYSGEFDFIHPAGLSIFITILLLAFIFRKSFCGWLCPFGSLSEAMALVGKKIMGRNLLVPRWLDYPLRSIKYLLLAFFVGSLFIMMPGESVAAFMISPYNTVADIKMLHFFQDISTTGSIFFGVLGTFSLFINGFWCRYLCPYGALLGLVSWFSPTAIQRDEEKCIDCGRCSESCHARLAVAKKKTLHSPECDSCLDCIASCPVDGALKVKIFNWSKGLLPYRYPLMVLGFFIGATLIFKWMGYWQTSITMEQYRYLIQVIEML